MQTEDAVQDEVDVIIESQSGETVHCVSGRDCVPDNYFVAAEDIIETVVVSTDSFHNPVVPNTSKISPSQNTVSVVRQNNNHSHGNSVASNLHYVLPTSSTPLPVHKQVTPEDDKTVSSGSGVGSETDYPNKDDGKVVEVKVIPIEMLYDGTLWSQFDLTKTSDNGEEDLFVTESVSTPLSVSDGVSDVARQVEVTTRSDNMCLSIRDIHKREKDKQKKRILRSDPVFREKEKQKAKERMQNRRQDPQYREQERQRDRERRQLARRRNHALREKERERDKEYKKNFRYGNRASTLPGAGSGQNDQCRPVDSLPCEVYLNTQYSAASS